MDGWSNHEPIVCYKKCACLAQKAGEATRTGLGQNYKQPSRSIATYPVNKKLWDFQKHNDRTKNLRGY